MNALKAETYETILFSLRPSVRLGMIATKVIKGNLATPSSSSRQRPFVRWRIVRLSSCAANVASYVNVSYLAETDQPVYTRRPTHGPSSGKNTSSKRTAETTANEAGIAERGQNDADLWL